MKKPSCVDCKWMHQGRLSRLLYGRDSNMLWCTSPARTSLGSRDLPKGEGAKRNTQCNVERLPSGDCKPLGNLFEAKR